MKNLFTREQFLNESDNDSEYPKFFEDLTKEEQEEAIDKNRYDAITDDWSEDVIQQFEEDLSEFGISDIEVSFTGFYSPGDGASFTTSNVDSKEFMTKALDLKNNIFIDFGKDIKGPDDDLSNLIGDLQSIGFNYDRMEPDNIYFSFGRSSSRYSHYNSVDVDIETDIYPEDWNNDMEDKMELYLSELETLTDEWRIDKSKELYNLLTKEYESLTSDELVREVLIDNEYEFDENGDIA